MPSRQINELSQKGNRKNELVTRPGFSQPRYGRLRRHTTFNEFKINFFSQNRKDAPLLVWLQGGPGAASMYGLFIEHGPFNVTKNLNVLERPTAWTQDYSVLYIDQPAYTGRLIFIVVRQCPEARRCISKPQIFSCELLSA